MTQPRILVTRPLPPGSLAPLASAPVHIDQWEHDVPMPREELLQRAAQADGILATLVDRIDQALLDVAPRLRAVANYAVGYDNVDVPACTRHGVLVSNTPGVLAETTADMAWALILAGARRIPEGVEYIRGGRWTTWGPMTLLGTDVHHRTLGIVGMGEIGWQVARRASGFDMRVLYASRTRRPDREAEAHLEYVPFQTLLAEADFVTLHVSLTPETRHLIGGPELARMKPTAYLVNTARGPVVDQHALYEACRDGVIAGAALDVTDPEPMRADDPLLSLPNVTVVPHVASATAATRLKMGTTAAENLAAFFTGRRPPTPVNPEVLDSGGA
ncbi:MAG: D-glycerate dehydrogenase [Chloroflexi bacterium]|nr:D-glycerate dehydrogenase [Chloroflexota bacterium]